MATGGDSTDEATLDLVEYESEQYSLTKVPAETSALVVAEKERLLGQIDLQALVDDLSRAGRFIRVAYNGVAGDTSMQITVQDIGYDITKLCDKAAITVVKFSRASHSVVLDLQATYEYLLDGLDDMAVDTLGSVSKLAEDMASAAKELGDAFQREEEKIETILKEVQIKKGEEDQFKRVNEMHRKRKADAVKVSKEATAAEKKSEEAYQVAYTAEAENAGLASGMAILTLIVPLAPFTIAGAIMSGKLAREARKEKIRQLQLMKAYDEQRKKAFAEIADFARKIQTYESKAAMGIGGDAAIDALHKAVGALKSLTVVMLRTADFWKKMEDHCKSISQTKMDDRLERALEAGRKHQKIVWAKLGFKRRAIQFFAQWVALQSVCTTYAKKIKVIQEQLYASIQENPTFEQSRAKIQHIATDLQLEMEKAYRDIDKNRAETDQQIEQLMEAEKFEEDVDST